MLNQSDFLNKLQKVKRGAGANQFIALCPAHDDNTRSLGIKFEQDKILVCCYAGCSYEDIRDSMRLSDSDFFELSEDQKRQAEYKEFLKRENEKWYKQCQEVIKLSETQNNSQKSGVKMTAEVQDKKVKQKKLSPPATYVYQDENGEPVFKVERFIFEGKKSFAQYTWNKTTKEWDNGTSQLPEELKPLYKLPQVMQAIDNNLTILIIEGEKDVETAEKLGFTATTKAGGAAKKWLPHYSEYLQNANVVIIPDNDEVGQAAAIKTAKALHGVAKSIKLLELPFVPYKGDLTDWVEDNPVDNTAESLQTLIDNLEEFDCSKELPDFTSSNRLQNMDKPLDLTELSHLIHAQINSAENKKLITDRILAKLVATNFKNELRYCVEKEEWLKWDGSIWKPDKAGSDIQACLYSIADGLRSEHKTTNNYDLECAIKRIESTQGLNSVKEQLKSVTPIPILYEELDKDKYLLSCPNGYLDLKTGELKKPEKSLMVTKQCPTQYNESAECPRWEQFLLEVFDNDVDLIRYIQKAVGYSLTGDVSERMFFLLYGKGHNGKSVFLNTLRYILGKEYVVRTDESALTDKATSLESIARLEKKRMVLAIESGEDRKLAEVRIKQLTGGEGEGITARYLYQNSIEFEPEGKIWIATNHLPEINGSDSAIWKRIALIPFNVEFKKPFEDGEPKIDYKLASKLMAESEGILNWAVKGCKLWQEERLGDNKTIYQAVLIYKSDMDILEDFIEKNIEQNINFDPITKSSVFDRYLEWCEENKIKAWSHKKFAIKFKERGFSDITYQNNKCWKCVRIINAERFIYSK